MSGTIFFFFLQTSKSDCFEFPGASCKLGRCQTPPSCYIAVPAELEGLSCGGGPSVLYRRCGNSSADFYQTTEIGPFVAHQVAWRRC